MLFFATVVSFSWSERTHFLSAPWNGANNNRDRANSGVLLCTGRGRRLRRGLHVLEFGLRLFRVCHPWWDPFHVQELGRSFKLLSLRDCRLGEQGERWIKVNWV